MSLLDYKIVALEHKGSHVTVFVRVYRGSFQDVVEEGVTVNRYVRIAKVRQFKLEYDIKRTMNEAELLEKANSYVNKKLVDYATANGHTVIPQQEDVSGYEESNNETET